jgi:hypothetical protein
MTRLALTFARFIYACAIVWGAIVAMALLSPERFPQ